MGILLKNYKTSLSKIETQNKEKIFTRALKFLYEPSKIFKKLKYEIVEKRIIECDTEERFSKMGISAVFHRNFNKKEREKITNVQKKIIFQILKKKLKKESKVLDFGCGYGRFSNFFVKRFSSFYFGVEKSKSLLKTLKNEKKKKFLSYSNFVKNKKFKGYFDLCFVVGVLGGMPKNKIKKYIKILKNSIKPNGLIFFIEIISDREIEGVWRLRTINFYKSLFSDFKILSEFYFIEDGRNKGIFLGKKINP